MSTDNKFIKYETIDEAMGIIAGIQEAAFVCTHLKNTSIANEEHISFDLFENENSKPRFTVFIVDAKPERGNSPYAAFIVPQGRYAYLIATTYTYFKSQLSEKLNGYFLQRMVEYS